jgi:hypothetical protein
MGNPAFLLGVLVVAALAPFASAAPAASESETLLFDFRRGADPATFRTADATVEPAGPADRRVLRVSTRIVKGWPGVTLMGPAGGWNLGAAATVEVLLHNPGSTEVKVFCRVDNPGADGTKHCVTGELRLGAGKDGVLKVGLERAQGDTLGGKLFGMRGYPVRSGGDRTLDAARVTQVLLFVSQPAREHVFEVERVVATGRYTPPTAWLTDADPYFPLIDPLGQYRHRNWPGKAAGVEDLNVRREAEARQLADDPGPGGWSKYGGWADGPRLAATGFFRVEKHAGKWWLVDPEGHLFWSHGVDCVRMLDATPVDERAAWFEGFPGDQPEFAEFVVPAAYALKGHYAGRSPRCFSFAGANLLRKYGSGWKTAYPEVVQRRLRGWGLNTIANWSDARIARMRRTPYTDNVHSRGARMIEASEGYWSKFPDVFDPKLADGLRREMAGKKGGSAGDPWCLGYFSDNEMSWGDEYSLAEAALKSPADQPAKQAFLADLRAKYGAIAGLNAAWGTSHESWDALAGQRTAPDRNKAGPDLAAFSSRTAETYFRAVRDAIREGAPGQLYLGCRFAWANARAAAAAAKYCDVVSYNLYQRSIADFVFDGGADVPLIVGEFHFGALDRGMFHTGLVPVPNQEARARAYTDYVEGALRHRQFVGTHWFQWQDEPTTGRVYDEENYQIGLVDIADTPYSETVAAVRRVGDRMYRLRWEAR